MRKEELFHIIGEVDEQNVISAGMAMTAKKKSRPVWLKWGAMAACLCLVVIGVLVAPGLQGEPGGAVPLLSGTPDTDIIQSGNHNGRTEPGRTNLLVVNEVESVRSVDMDVQFSRYESLSETGREMMLKQFETAIGRSYNDFTAKISDTFMSKSFYSVDIPVDTARTEYTPHDYVLEYQTENGGRAIIALCSYEEPLRDCLIKCDHPEQSEINGIRVVIYGYQDSFIVQFSYENVNYDIGTGNITLAELEDLLTGIMG